MAPKSAPARHSITRNAAIVRRIRAHKAWSFDRAASWSVQDGLLEIVEQPADVQIAPGRIGGERTSAPEPDAAARERADHIDPLRVEQVVLVPVMLISRSMAPRTTSFAGAL